MRARETGITQVSRAENADVMIIPLHGDLYLLRGEHPLERLTQTASPEIDPRLSPDGAKVAFVRDDELYVLDLESRKERRLTSGAEAGLTHGLAEFMAQEEMDRFAGYWWSPDGESLAYQETDERRIPLYSIVHQGNEHWSVETHRYPFAGAENAKVRLGIVPAGGGKTRWLNLTDSSEDFYLARVDWEKPGSLLVQILSRNQKSLKLLRVNTQTGLRTQLLEECAQTWVNLHDDLRVLKGGDEFLWSSERTGFRHLELRDRRGDLVRILTEGTWPVDQVLAVVESRREVWFSAGRDSPCERQVYRVSLEGGKIERITLEPGMHNAVISNDGETIVDTFSSRRSPPTTTLRDRSGQAKFTLADASKDPRMKAVRLDPPILTQFRNRDGVVLHGAYYPARSKAMGEKSPLIVMVYGGPHIQTVTDSWAITSDMMAQFLTEKGFAIWKMDNRGSSRRGHVFEETVHRKLGDVEVRDQVDGVKFAGTCWPEVDLTRVGVMGGSYGGYMTLRCLIMAPEVFKAGVASAPVTDWDGYDTCYTERYMGTPGDNAGGYKASSVLNHAHRLKGSLLLIHGLLDENVHYRHTARLMNAFVNADKVFSILPMPESRHGARREVDRTYITERTVNFLETSLGRPSN
ncbi:MAG: S9 family peptidase [Isosphaeraceae bacterium]